MVAWKAARVLVGSFVFAAIAPWTSGASSARAQTCEKNEDCPQGFSCHEEQSASDCPPVAACDAGAGAKDCATPAPCGESVVTHACRPASCETNADCGGGSMVCYEHKSIECAGGTSAASCAPNETCEPAAPAPEMCTQTSEKTCTPRYVLPCQEAADCGDGFTCESDMECSCSGSSGSSTGGPQPSEDAGTSTAADAAFAPRPPSEPAVDGGVAPDAGSKPAQDGGVDGGGGGQAPACECHTLATKHCALKTIQCQGDSDCPSDFACVTYAGGSVDCASSKAADAAVCGAALPTGDVKMCAPRYDWGGWSAGRDAEDSGHYASGPVSVGDKSGKTEPPMAAGGSDAGVSADDAGAAMTADNASACSVAAPGARTGSAGVLAGFVLLALGAGGRRRARRLQR